MVKLLFDELSLTQIFFFLSPEDLSVRVGQVCKQWYGVSVRNDLWRFMCYKFVSYSGKNSKIGIDEFFDSNRIDTRTPDHYFKKVYYDKKIKSSLNLVFCLYSGLSAKQTCLENDVALLKYIPHNELKEKKSMNFTVKIGEKPEFIEEIIRHRDLICVTENNSNYIVITLCEASHKQTKKNHTSFKILCKYVMKLSSGTLQKSKRWEYKLIEKQISIQSYMKGYTTPSPRFY